MKLAFIHIGMESSAIEILSAILSKKFPDIEKKLFFHFEVFWNPLNTKRSNEIKDHIVSAIKDFHPDICCYSAYTDTYDVLCKIAEEAKLFSKDIINVFGGIHVTMVKSEALEKNKDIDIVVVGEGEEAFEEVMREIASGKKRWGEIKGIIYRSEGAVISNPMSTDLVQLDQVPFPDKSFFRKYLPEVYDPYFIMTSRGCPHNCSYCSSPYIKALYGSVEYFRRRSVDNVMAELESVKDRIQRVWFMDEVFVYSIDYLERFLPLYKERIGLPFVCYTSPSYCDERRIGLLKAGGCERISMGVQSGSENIRHNYFNRIGTNADIIKASRVIRAHRIKYSADIILGTPYETGDDIKMTLDLLCEIRPNFIQLFYLSYYPELDITKKAMRDGYITKESYEKIRAGLFNKSYYRGSYLTDRSLRYIYKAWLMCMLIPILPNRLSRWLVKNKVYDKFPSGLLWHIMCYFLTTFKYTPRKNYIYSVIRKILFSKNLP